MIDMKYMFSWYLLMIYFVHAVFCLLQGMVLMFAQLITGNITPN